MGYTKLNIFLHIACQLLIVREGVSLPYLTKERQESMLTERRFRIIRKKQAESYPYHATGQVLADFGVGERWGTGVLIGRQYVLTAAHNLYDHALRSQAGEIMFFPGKTNDNTFSWAYSAKHAIVHQKYQFSKKETYDIGIFKLEEPVSKKLGWYGLKAFPINKLSGKKVTIRGYPSSDRAIYASYNNCLCENKGRIEKISHRRRISYKINTLIGHSGSGLEVKIKRRRGGEEYYCAGIHAYGREEEKAVNSGIRICKNRFKDIRRWIKELDRVAAQDSIPIGNMQRVLPREQLLIKRARMLVELEEINQKLSENP